MSTIYIRLKDATQVEAFAQDPRLMQAVEVHGGGHISHSLTTRVPAPVMTVEQAERYFSSVYFPQRSLRTMTSQEADFVIRMQEQFGNECRRLDRDVERHIAFLKQRSPSPMNGCAAEQPKV